MSEDLIDTSSYVPPEKEPKAGTEGEGIAGGLKWDKGKIDWSLLPMKELEDVVRVLQYGEKKYKRSSWAQLEMGKLRYYSAALRHLFAFMSGEEIDSESGLRHISQSICNLIFISYLSRKDKYPLDEQNKDT